MGLARVVSPVMRMTITKMEKSQLENSNLQAFHQAPPNTARTHTHTIP